MRIVDAGMLAFSAWHALKGRVDWPLTYQVPRMLRPLLEKAEDTCVLCWNGEDLWKRERWPAYRDRPEIWEEADQADFEALLETLTALGAVQFRTDRLEADEAIAALAHRFEGEEEIVLVSDDKDFMQLLSGSTRMEGRVRGTVRFSDVKEILGVTPAFVADFLAVSGDRADGIPRILPPARARALIESRGHVADWVDRDLRVDEKTKRAIVENRAQLRINLELVDLSEPATRAHDAPGDPLLDGWGDLDRAREVGERTGVSWLTEDDLGEAYAAIRTRGERTRDRLGI